MIERVATNGQTQGGKILRQNKINENVPNLSIAEHQRTVWKARRMEDHEINHFPNSGRALSR